MSTEQRIRVESGFAYGVIGADIHVFGDGVPVYLLENWPGIPDVDSEFLTELPSRMLNSRFAVVQFIGREAELRGLNAWRGSRLASGKLFGHLPRESQADLESTAGAGLRLVPATGLREAKSCMSSLLRCGEEPSPAREQSSVCWMTNVP